MPRKGIEDLPEEIGTRFKKMWNLSSTLPKWFWFFYIVMFLFILISGIIVISMNILSDLSSSDDVNLAPHLSVIMLSTIMLLYMIQILAAVWLSLKKQSQKIVDIHGTWAIVQVPESNFTWTIRDFRDSSGPWILLIVAIFLPTMLSFIPHTMLVFSDIIQVDGDSPLTETDLQIIGLIYYLCVSLIAVLITMEASFLMNLRDVGGIWTSMLLASMVIDIISLFFLHNIGSPLQWKGTGFEGGATGVYIFFLIFFSFFSSFLTILFARASREMVFEALVLDSKDKVSQKTS